VSTYLNLPDSFRCWSSNNSQVSELYRKSCLVSYTSFTFREHAHALSARQAIAQSRKSRGLFSWFRRGEPEFRPTYNYETDGSACRIYGSLQVKKVTGMSNPDSPPLLLTYR